MVSSTPLRNLPTQKIPRILEDVNMKTGGRVTRGAETILCDVKPGISPKFAPLPRLRGKATSPNSAIGAIPEQWNPAAKRVMDGVGKFRFLGHLRQHLFQPDNAANPAPEQLQLWISSCWDSSAAFFSSTRASFSLMRAYC